MTLKWHLSTICPQIVEFITQMCPIVSAFKDLRFHPQRVGLLHVFLRLDGFYASNVKDGHHRNTAEPWIIYLIGVSSFLIFFFFCWSVMWINWGNILSTLNTLNGHLTSWLLMRLSSPLQKKYRVVALLFIRKAFNKTVNQTAVSLCSLILIKGSISCICVCMCHFWELPRKKKLSVFTSDRGEQNLVKAAREARLVPRAVDMGRAEVAENVDRGEQQERRSLR